MPKCCKYNVVFLVKKLEALVVWFVKYDDFNVRKWLKMNKSFQVPNWKNFLEVPRHPPSLGVIKFPPACLNMLEKNYSVNIFSLFSTKNFDKKIVTRFWYFFSKLIECFNKKSFLLKFLFWKTGKIFNKIIFF